MASMAGVIGQPDMTDYCASKFGAIGLMESLRTELKKQGKNNVICTTICPYYINTGLFDGVKTSLFYPLLKQEDVVNRTINAIL
jgi:all-trans-retinol dehydrogenase (NAD+)